MSEDLEQAHERAEALSRADDRESADPNDLEVWLERARTNDPDSPEIAPGVTRAEAEAAAAHAIVIQKGYSTPEIEAERLSKDRARASR